MSTAASPLQQEETITQRKRPSKWNVIIDNDPVNLMEYVTRIIRKVFGYDENQAAKLMMQVHTNGKAVVWTGAKEQAEAYLFELQKAQLSCHLEEVEDD
jgi:ATP-dependent Clp protease adaptor protein ClpS